MSGTNTTGQGGPAGNGAADSGAAANPRHRFVAEMRNAMRLHQSGKLDRAAEAYDRALALDPEQPDALNYAGYLAYQLGDAGRALTLIERSIALAADNPHFICNLAKVQQAVGRLDEAAANYRRTLDLNPKDTQAQFNLAVVLDAQGRIEDAKAAYQKVLEINQNDSRALNNLGNLWERDGYPNRAAAIYRQALDFDPNDTIAQNNLGGVLKELGEIEEAVICYKRTLTIDPNNAVAHSELGGLCVERGEHDEAVAALRRAIALEPALGSAYRRLGAAKTYAADDPDLATMERLIADPALSDQNAIDLRFALGKAFEDLEDYETAFAHFAEGNRLKRQSINVNVADAESEAERIIATFDEALFARHIGAGCDSELPIFVLGMPHSGTTLVEQILASHPQVHGAGEIREFLRFALRLPEAIGAADAFPDCVAAIGHDRWAELGGDYIDVIRQHDHAAARLTDKVPNNFRFIGLIHLLLPKARIIHCHQDPLDTCMSCFKLHFARGLEWSYDLADLGRFYRTYQRYMEHWQSLLPSRTLEVRYEDLVGDIEAGARRLVAHCGLEWDDACLAFHQSERPVHTASALQVRKSVYQTSVQAWRHYERHLGPLKQALEGLI